MKYKHLTEDDLELAQECVAALTDFAGELL